MNTLEVVLARRAKRDAWNQHAATLRDEDEHKPVKPKRKPGRPPTHGHENAYWRHINAGEKPCDPCIEAHDRANAHKLERFHERKATQ